jgi:hypothetical protein
MAHGCVERLGLDETHLSKHRTAVMKQHRKVVRCCFSDMEIDSHFSLRMHAIRLQA